MVVPQAYRATKIHLHGPLRRWEENAQELAQDGSALQERVGAHHHLHEAARIESDDGALRTVTFIVDITQRKHAGRCAQDRPTSALTISPTNDELTVL